MHRMEQQLEAERQKKQLGAKSDQDIKPNKRFKNFDDIFSGLTRSKNVLTQYPIVSCMMTYNSKSALTVTKKSDREYYVHQFSLETYLMTFEEVYGGIDEVSYIKLNDIQQNQHGTLFAAVYLDDGHFYLRTFGETSRSEEEILENELDINKVLKFNNHTMPINNFYDPFIACCFVQDDLLFVNLFHNKQRKHHQFFWRISTRQMTNYLDIEVSSGPRNFPVKCFYNSEYNEVYSFYR